MEARLFPENTIPEYTTPEWYLSREHAPHLEQEGHRQRLIKSASFVAQAVLGHKDATVVDLGAGDGGLLSLLSESIKAWGYDLMPENIEVAKRRGVDVRLANVLEDEIEWGTIAVATEILEHLVNPHDFVCEIAKHSKYIVASSPLNETPDNHYEFHTWCWDMQGYADLIGQAGYDVLRHENMGHTQVILGRLV